MTTPLRLDADNRLLCPACGFDYVHLELITVGARREDQAVTQIDVDTVNALVLDAPPTGEARSSRRHWVELHVTCEGCAHAGSLVFSQHKGQTYVEHMAATHPG